VIVRSTQGLVVQIVLGCAMLCNPSHLGAQQAVPPAGMRRVFPAVRADFLPDRDVGAQVAVGGAVAAAYNLRLAVDVGVGGVRRATQWEPTGRIDLLARWLSDPFRQSRWGLNAGGGIGVRFEADRTPRTIAIVTLGVEGRGDGRWVPGVEAGMGGGFRLGLTLRRPAARRR